MFAREPWCSSQTSEYMDAFLFLVVVSLPTTALCLRPSHTALLRTSRTATVAAPPTARRASVSCAFRWPRGAPIDDPKLAALDCAIITSSLITTGGNGLEESTLMMATWSSTAWLLGGVIAGGFARGSIESPARAVWACATCWLAAACIYTLATYFMALSGGTCAGFFCSVATPGAERAFFALPDLSPVMGTVLALTAWRAAYSLLMGSAIEPPDRW